MAKFTVMTTVNDPNLKSDALFTYKILDNENYEIDDRGGVQAKSGYKPQIGDKFTVEVWYECKDGHKSKVRKTFTVKA